MQKDFLKQHLLTQFEGLSDIKPIPHLSLGSAKYHRAIYQGKSVVVRTRGKDHKTDFEQDDKVTRSQESNPAVPDLIITNTAKSKIWFEFTLTPSYFHMIMDDFLGTSLHDLFQQEPLTLEERLNVIRQLVLGLKVLHESQQYFPKLCARNIFLKHKEVKMTDFSSLDSSYINSPETSCYIAPEILEKKQAHTSSTDIYACGMLLLAILLWRDPNPKLLARIDKFFPQYPHEYPQYLEELKNLVKKCFHSNPQSRPTTDESLYVLNTILYPISHYSFIEISPDNDSTNLSLKHEHEIDAYFNSSAGKATLTGDEFTEIKELYREETLTGDELTEIKELYGEVIVNRISRNPKCLIRSNKNTISIHAIYCEQEFYPTHVVIFTIRSFVFFNSCFFLPPGSTTKRIGNLVFLHIQNRDLFISPMALLWRGNNYWSASLHRIWLLRELSFFPQSLGEIITDYHQPELKQLNELTSSSNRSFPEPLSSQLLNRIFSNNRTYTLEQQLGWEKEFKALAPQLGILEKIRHYILEDKLSFSSKLSQLICSYIDEGLFEKISQRIQHDYPETSQSVNKKDDSSGSGLLSLYHAGQFLSGILYPNKTLEAKQHPGFADFKQWVNQRGKKSTGHSTAAELTQILKLMADDKTILFNFGSYLKEMQEIAQMPPYTIIDLANGAINQLQLLANLYRLSQLAHTKTLHFFIIGDEKHWHVQFLAQGYGQQPYRFIHMNSAATANSKAGFEIDLWLLGLLKKPLYYAKNLAQQIMPDYKEKLDRSLETAVASPFSLLEPFMEERISAVIDFCQTFSKIRKNYNQVFQLAQKVKFLNECKPLIQDVYFQFNKIEIKSQKTLPGNADYYNVIYHGKNALLRVENQTDGTDFKEELIVRRSQVENPYIMQPKVSFLFRLNCQLKYLATATLIDEVCTLYDLFAQKPFSLKVCLEIAQQIASGLYGLHQKNIIYTNLSPWHIFLEARNRIRMIGFSPITLEETRMSPVVFYLSPEMVNTGQTRKGSDIFSFGAVLLAMILRNHPQHLTSLPALNRLFSQDPLGLGEFIGWCFCSNPNERPSAIESKSKLKEISDKISPYVLLKKSADNSTVYISCDTQLQSQCYFNFLGGEKKLTENQLQEIKISLPAEVYEQICRNPYCLSLDAENKVSFHAFHCRKELYPTMIMIFTTEVFELFNSLFYLPTNTEIQRLHTLVYVRIQNQDLFLDSALILFRQKKMQPELIDNFYRAWLLNQLSFFSEILGKMIADYHQPDQQQHNEFESAFYGDRCFPEPIYSKNENIIFWKKPKPERTLSLSLEEELGWEKEHDLLDSEFGVLKKIQDFISEFIGLPSVLSQLISNFIDEGIFEKIRWRIQNDYQKTTQSVGIYPSYVDEVAQQDVHSSSESGFRALYNAGQFLAEILYPQKTIVATEPLLMFEDFRRRMNDHFTTDIEDITPVELTGILKLMVEDKTFFPNFGLNLKEMQDIAGMPPYTILDRQFTFKEGLFIANIYRLSQRAHTKTLHCFFIYDNQQWHAQFLAQGYGEHHYRFIHMDSTESANRNARSVIDLLLLERLKNPLNHAEQLAQQVMPDCKKALQYFLDSSKEPSFPLQKQSVQDYIHAVTEFFETFSTQEFTKDYSEVQALAQQLTLRLKDEVTSVDQNQTFLYQVIISLNQFPTLACQLILDYYGNGARKKNSSKKVSSEEKDFNGLILFSESHSSSFINNSNNSYRVQPS